MAQLATPICPDKDGLGRSHSCSFDHRRRANILHDENWVLDQAELSIETWFLTRYGR
jgi:hypothetical protein